MAYSKQARTTGTYTSVARTPSPKSARFGMGKFGQAKFGSTDGYTKVPSTRSTTRTESWADFAYADEAKADLITQNYMATPRPSQ